MSNPIVQHFFDEPTNTFSYVVRDPDSNACAILDSVLDFDYAAGRTDVRSADEIIDYVEREGLSVEWVLETHVHADHLSAAPYLHETLGGVPVSAPVLRTCRKSSARPSMPVSNSPGMAASSTDCSRRVISSGLAASRAGSAYPRSHARLPDLCDR